jgi:hypothetical protein
VADYNRATATARLQKLGIKVESGAEKNSLRFRDLNNLTVEITAA